MDFTNPNDSSVPTIEDFALYTMMKSSTPATQALNKKLLESQDSHSALGGDNQLVRRQVSVKRSSSQMLGSMLDMTSLLEASEDIEGCPSFPNIEWPTLDHNNQDATDICAPQGKM
ncbi:MAG: hypothetical protein SGBAC_009672 [Bacillariaceae sp.]